jgi:hypothetical protein
MSKERVPDPMIAGFGRRDDQTAVCEAPNVQRKTEDPPGVQTGLDVLDVARSRNWLPTGDPDVAVDSSQVTSESRVEYSKQTASNVQNVPKSSRVSLASHTRSRDLCASCRRPITPGATVLDLADDNRVDLAGGCGCLIAWGARWRAAPRAAVSETADKGAGRPDIPSSEANNARSCPYVVEQEASDERS